MFYVDNGTGIETMPKVANKQSNVITWFTEGDASNSPSYPGQDWFNMIQAELLNALTAAEVTPKKGQHDQLAGIISTLIKNVKTAQDTADASLTVGDIQLKPFRASELPFGWYFANGDAYELSTDIGKALQSLSSNYKADWGIFTTTATITLPNMFYSDGRGYFLRGVDGKTRQVGSVENDAMRDISFDFITTTSNITTGGALTSTTLSQITFKQYGDVTLHTAHVQSNFLGAAEENRSLNVGMTPAIYLGV